MDLKALKAKHEQLLADAKAIQTASKALGNADLTDAEAEKVSALLDDADKAAEQIKTLEKRQGIADRLKKADAFGDEAEATRVPATAGAETAKTSDLKNRLEDDPKKGFKSPQAFVLAVVENGERKGASIKDERLRYLSAGQGEKGATAGSDEHGEYDDARGGFLLPEGFSPNLLQLNPEADPVSSRVQQVPMSATTVKIPARVDKDHTSSVSGGLTVSRKAETVASGTSRTQLEQVALHAHSLFGGSYATEELLEDSPISFAAIIARGFADQFTHHLLGERISGTGTGEFEGVLNTPCLVTVSKEAGQPADTIYAQNVIKMRSRCWNYSQAVWIANHDTIPELTKLQIAVGTGGHALYMPSYKEDVPDMLLGRPIVFSEYAKTLGDVGDLILGVWGEYLEGTYQPLRSAESIHVRFLNHERTFKFWMRNDGRCWWRSALTPKNSTKTLSPFVVTEAR